MPYDPPLELASLSLPQIAELTAARKLPPVEQWSPEREGDSGMRIAADGSWFHDGVRLTRPGMVRAFSGLLARDDAGQHWLISPHEKLSITVEDAPFVAVDVAQKGEDLAFRLNTDELVIAGPDHRLVARGDPERPAIYLQVRRGCEARLNRTTYEQLAQIALAADDGWQVASGGETFSFLPR